MKKNRGRLLEAAILLAGTVSFWGFLYPEFSMAEDVCIKSRIWEYIVEQTSSVGKTDGKNDITWKIVEVAFNDKQKCTDWGI